MQVTKQYKFEAAHRLRFHKGRCKNIHGHSYVVEATFEGVPDVDGIVVDFSDWKARLHALLDPWDHALILDADDPMARTYEGRMILLDGPPTAENMAQHIKDRLSAWRVRVFETTTSWADA